jgi:peptidoglycan/LPS O-acetylase OafA/YrhL
VLGLALILYLYMPYTQSVVFYSTAVAGAVIAGYLLMVRKPLEARGATRWLAFLGKHSLEIFLIHQPLMREFNRYALANWMRVTNPGDGMLLVGIVGSVVVTLFASVELRRLTNKLSTLLLRPRPVPKDEIAGSPNLFPLPLRHLSGSYSVITHRDADRRERRVVSSHGFDPKAPRAVSATSSDSEEMRG